MLSLNHIISSVHDDLPMRRCLKRASVEKFQCISLQGMRGRMQNRSYFLTEAKKIDLQDKPHQNAYPVNSEQGVNNTVGAAVGQFEQNRIYLVERRLAHKGYAKPRRLLHASEVILGAGTSLKEVLSSMDYDEESRSLYLMHLKTSHDFGSSLSDSNSAILICMIDVNGDSILQRIPAIRPENGGNLQEMDLPDMLCFQRGYDETLTFKGPKLGNIEAVWIGVEMGSWRLGGVSLTVINPNHSSSSLSEEGKQQHYVALKYGFECESSSNILLGGDISMVQLSPTLVTEVKADVSSALEIVLPRSTSISNHKPSPEESMKEYADLKLSLLLYDAMLVFAGSSIAASANEKAARGFLVGGILGFLYLVLLQKSVDGLSGPELSNVNENEKRESRIEILGGFKSPVTSFALVLILTALVLKYASGNASSVLTPQELLAGALGFLTCKVAVVLAAFKPMKTRLKQKE